ncbi:amino acid/polyamine transporter I [Mariannaea sp. PMI_226]|nr:amino acid/polyamine transporter I [Mariannaea sp. PMI_226]
MTTAKAEKHADQSLSDSIGIDTGEHASVIIETSQDLPERFGLLSLIGVGLLIGTVWPASGGSIQVAIFNGGPPGVLYEFLAVSIFYLPVTASLAELASAMPSSAGVYHWASVTPGKRYGRMIGFFAGWWNYLAWVFGAASMAFIWSNTIIQLYALKHPDYTTKTVHVFAIYITSTWLACLLVCFFSRAMPYLNKFGIYWLLGGFAVTILVLAIMPGRDGRPDHASSTFVWTEWHAELGYPPTVVFLTGMLNGAYSVGCPAAVSHLAEEIPAPRRNVPIAMAFQMVTGFITGFSYLIVLMYSINDYDALFTSQFPIAEIYLQGTGSPNGAICLLIVMQVCIGLSMVGLYITSGRALWALSRDGATPFQSVLSVVNVKYEMPLNSTVASAALVTIMGCIYVGSTTAFNAFVGSYVLMSSSSYIAAILPHLLTGRHNIQYGPFRLGKITGYLINTISSVYMICWFVIYCLPFSLPVTAETMNFACLIWGSLTIFLGTWWTWKGSKGYRGPVAETIPGERGR